MATLKLKKPVLPSAATGTPDSDTYRPPKVRLATVRTDLRTKGRGDGLELPAAPGPGSSKRYRQWYAREYARIMAARGHEPRARVTHVWQGNDGRVARLLVSYMEASPKRYALAPRQPEALTGSLRDIRKQGEGFARFRVTVLCTQADYELAVSTVTGDVATRRDAQAVETAAHEAALALTMARQAAVDAGAALRDARAALAKVEHIRAQADAYVAERQRVRAEAVTDAARKLLASGMDMTQVKRVDRRATAALSWYDKETAEQAALYRAPYDAALARVKAAETASLAANAAVVKLARAHSAALTVANDARLAWEDRRASIAYRNAGNAAELAYAIEDRAPVIERARQLLRELNLSPMPRITPGDKPRTKRLIVDPLHKRAVDAAVAQARADQPSDYTGQMHDKMVISSYADPVVAQSHDTAGRTTRTPERPDTARDGFTTREISRFAALVSAVADRKEAANASR